MITRGARVRAGVLGAALLAGCSSGPQEPRMRLGSLPFPGPFTLYATADPRRLGVHRYQPWWEDTRRPGETSRGILYTRAAGFLDVSHIREYLDWSKFIHDRALARLRGSEHGPAEWTWSDLTYRLELTAPPQLAGLAPGGRERAEREFAAALGAHLSVVMGTWHEIATWHGQKTIPGISEKNSAFTWDDAASHAVAAIAAERALLSPERNWNLAATRALNDVVAELGPVDEAEESEAVAKVKGVWWSDGVPLRRDLDTGLETGVKTAWLVPGFAAEPRPLPIPRWRRAAGLEWGAAVAFTVRAPSGLSHRMTGIDREAEFDAEGALPGSIERLRAALLREFGPGADSPAPDAALTTSPTPRP